MIGKRAIGTVVHLDDELFMFYVAIGERRFNNCKTILKRTSRVLYNFCLTTVLHPFCMIKFKNYDIRPS